MSLDVQPVLRAFKSKWSFRNSQPDADRHPVKLLEGGNMGDDCRSVIWCLGEWAAR